MIFRLLVIGAMFLSVPMHASTLTWVNESSSLESRLTLRRQGELLTITDSDSHAILTSAPVASTQRVAIFGAEGNQNDTLTIDLTQPFELRDGIDYDGGAGGWDVLTLEGGSAREQRVTQLNPHDGVIQIDGLLIRYLNLEPITDTVAAATFTITGTAGIDTVTITDGPAGTTTVSSPTFESVSFANKTLVTFDGLGGGDTVAFNNPTPATGLTTFIVTNVATVTQTGALHYTSFGANATGAVTLSTVVNDVDNLEITTQNGNVAFRDANSITIGGVSPALSGVRATTTGSLDLRIDAGNLTLSDPDGADILRAGNASGDVLVFLNGDTLSVTVDRDAIIAPAGSIDVTVGYYLLLGTVVPNSSNDIRAAGSVSLLASIDLVVAGQTRVASDDFGTNSGGALTARGIERVELDGTATIGAAGTAGADADILTGGNGVLNLLATGPTTLFSTSGDVQITTAVLAIDSDSGVSAPLGRVAITTFMLFMNNILLGPATDASGLGPEISDAEIDRIFSPILAIEPQGRILVSQPITFTTGTELLLVGSYAPQGSGTGSLSAQVLSLNFDLYSWAITPTSFTMGPDGTAVPYTGVTTLNARSSSAIDTLSVAPHPTTTINVDGNLPNPPNGDTLDFDLTGVTSPVLIATLTPSGYQGSVTSSNRAPINFQEVEKLVDAPVDLTITKTDGATTDVAGTAMTYTITVTNAASIPVVGAVVNDAFPADLSNVTWTCSPSAGSACSAAGAGNLAEGVTLAANGSVTFTVNGTLSPSATGTLANTATVATPAGYLETNAVNNSATDTTTVTAEADLTITKTGSGSAAAGVNLNYTIALRNMGPSDAQNVTLTDVLPAGTTFVSLDAPVGYSCTTPGIGAAGTVTCTRSVLPPLGTPDTFVLVTRVASTTPAGTIITNTATATSTTVDPSPANAATATAPIVAANIPTLSMAMLALFTVLIACVAWRGMSV